MARSLTSNIDIPACYKCLSTCPERDVGDTLEALEVNCTIIHELDANTQNLGTMNKGS